LLQRFENNNNNNNKLINDGSVILTVQQVTGSIPSNVVLLCLLRIASISVSSLVRSLARSLARSRAFMVLCMRSGERKSRRRRRIRTRRRSGAAAALAAAAVVWLCGILRGAGRRCLVQVASEVATRSHHGRNRSAVKLLLLNAVSSVRCVAFLLFFFFLT
jgi:hypothetical protein